MNIIYENLSSNYGTTQQTRFLEALSPDYVRIDDRTTPEFLAFLAEYSKHIRFIDEKHENNHVWSELLMKDISVILSSIITYDIQSQEKEFNRVRGDFDKAQSKEEKQKAFFRFFESVYTIALRQNEWYNLILNSSESEYPFKPQIISEYKEFINQKSRLQLTELFQQFCNAQRRGLIQNDATLNFDAFHSDWKLNQEEMGFIEEDRMPDIIPNLRIIYKSFINGITYLTIRLEHFFQKSIHEQSDHSPHIALLIAFIQIFKFAQTEINNVTSHYLNFYFTEILQQKKHQGEKDEVNVIVKLSSHIDQLILPAGTPFYAGRNEEGEEIIYESVRDFNLNRAEILSLKTLFMSRKQEVQIGSFSLVTGIYAAPIADSKDGKGLPLSKQEKTWPTFGEEQEGKAPGKGTMIDGKEEMVEIGFAITSPVLFLSEGERSIELILEFNENSTAILNVLLQDILKKYRNNPEKNIQTLVDAFRFVFRKDEEDKNIKVFITDYAGWNDINYDNIYISPLNTHSEVRPEKWDAINGIKIEVKIKPSAPPITAYDSSIHKGHKFPLAKFPVIKVVLDTDTSPYLYSFWENLELFNIKMNVKVDKIKNIKCYNDLGSLDISQPFQPFGPTPGSGSYLLFTNEEICRKQVTKMNFTLKWKNLPFSFEEYYEAYRSQNLTKDAFKIKISGLSQGEFLDIEKSYALFGYDSETTLEISRDEYRELEWEANPYMELEAFDSQSKSGFIKWTLSEPSIAFGHQIYPTLFSQTLLDKAMNQLGNEAKLPNQPYTPVIESFVFSYEATAEIKVGGGENPDERFYHVQPFGNSVIRKHDTHYLLPQFKADGYLFIGLSNLIPGEVLNLLLELSPINTKGKNVFRLPDVEWAYLAKDKWVTFIDAHNNNQILIDTTDKFTKSGVISLQIPDEISDRNHVFPGELFWLCVRVSGNVDALCHTVGIHTQAVMLKREKEIGNNKSILGPYMIDNLYEKRAEVAEVIQPYHSFNGRKSESDTDFFLRVSERNRHKNRAITSWDYERLILEKFPSIFQVKTLSYNTHPQFFTKPNDICLVVVPQMNIEYDGLTPKVNQQMLNGIRSFIEQKVSPFVRVKVRNPIYEFIRIRCNIKFIDTANVGSRIEELNREIQRLICPWSEKATEAMYVGGVISIDAMFNYIKSLPYVKFITKFSVLQFYCPEEDKDIYVYHDSANKEMDSDKKRVIQSFYPWSVLIPDDHHEIVVVEKEEEEQPEAVMHEVPFQNRMKIIRRAIKISRKAKTKEKEPEQIDSGSDEKYSVQIEV